MKYSVLHDRQNTNEGLELSEVRGTFPPPSDYLDSPGGSVRSDEGEYSKIINIPVTDEYNDEQKLITSESRSSSFIQLAYDIIYPPHIDHRLQLFSKDNIVLPVSYCLVGIYEGLSAGIMTLFLLQINATEAQQVSIGSLSGLPASFKVLFGFISDAFPIFGYRRKVYMVCGWILASISMLYLAYLEATTTDLGSSQNVDMISLMYFLFGFGFWFSDVISDSVITEKVKFETTENQGRLQSTCYSIRFFSMLTATIFTTFFFDYVSVSSMFLFMGLLPWFSSIPFSILFTEEKSTAAASTSISVIIREIWSLLCTKAIWKPISFIFIYNSMQVGNAAWTQYMYTVLKFTNTEINSFLLLSYVLLVAGVNMYKYYFRNTNFRYIYVSCTVLQFILSILQVLLILRVNVMFGISAYFFSLGDDAFSEFVYGIQYLPSVLMIAKLCPVGAEGTAYALFTSINNCALFTSTSLSTLLLSVWDVSKQTLENGDLTGLLKLTILTSLIQCSASFFVFMMPSGLEELQSLDFSIKSKKGGAIALFLLTCIVCFAIISNILNIVMPSWAGGS